MPKGIYKRTNPAWNKGTKGVMKANKASIKKGEHRGIKTEFKKGADSLIGKNNSSWKGEDASYDALHYWVRNWKGQPDTCENCGKNKLFGKQIHWANIDHTYKRVLEDYIRLCASCHKKYDIEKNFHK